MTELHGIFPYLVSPVDEGGRVQSDALGRLVNDLIAAGVHGLTPLGSTGEFAYLGNEQRARSGRRDGSSVSVYEFPNQLLISSNRFLTPPC